MWRNALGVVVGAILWMVSFFSFARLLFSPWPAYGEKARVWMRSGVFEFTSPMACFNLLFWALAACVAGAVAMAIAKRRGAVLTLAVLLTAYLALLHLVLYWPRFPWWYNLGVVLPTLPAVLLGGRLARGRQNSRTQRR